MEFRDIMREFMEEEGLNQKQLAEKLGIKQGHLNDWLRGRSVPTYYHLQNICKKLDISGDRVLGLTDN